MTATYVYDLFGTSIPADTNEAVLISLVTGEELINCEVRAVNIDTSSHYIRVGIDTDGDNAANIWYEYDTEIQPAIPVSTKIAGLGSAYQVTVRTDTASMIHFSISGLKKISP